MKKTVFTLIFLFSIFTGFSQTNEEINNFKENNNNLLNELNVENDQLNDIIALTLKYNERKQSLESNGADSKFIQKNMKNPDFCSILASQTPPNPSQIEPKRPLGRLLGPLGPSWQQSLKKRRIELPQETPRRSQTPPKTTENRKKKH